MLTSVVIALYQQMANIACEKEKLESLEQQHLATANDLEACTDQDEAEMLRQRSMDEQDAVENQKFLVDNLEFQQLEVCFLINCWPAGVTRAFSYCTYHADRFRK